ncbi:MAG: gamma-glutamyltransferase [Candidatus Eremiobacteraeota bacterium]|nr:gamma-glutamyltransferase [Candidatus Eremiobacteraeota bacterium]MCW5866162.1 gamma-glutamyltransferase [Candidatus Eremiobacteraeota bacterium]
MLRRIVFSLVLLAPLLAGAAPTPVEQDRYRFPSAAGRHGMVASPEARASRAGIQVLKEGGNAVDAAVTMAFVLAVTLPRAGNIGGGGFMLIRDPQGKVYALDFRERAPAASTRTMLQDGQGDRDADKATVGALSVGVPGTVAGMDLALKRFGRWDLKRAVAPARKIAETGFPVPSWLTDEVERVRPNLTRFPDSKRIFFPNGLPLPTDSVWKQPELASTLAAIQIRGQAGFYEGPVAAKIAKSIQVHGGLMTVQDLKNYKALWREPVHGTYRGYDIASMPPPSSGGVHLIQALNVLEGFPMREDGLNSAINLHRIIETLRQCYADRSQWLGDPDFVKVPVEYLTSKDYAKKIRDQIPDRKARTSEQVAPARIPGYESDQTTHLSVADEKGWSVSMTYTLNFSYGSGLVAEGTGVLLNDEMDDFAAAPNKPNGFGLLGGKANAIEPGKRPLSSMTPTIVQRDGQFVAAVGSPGGSTIITAVLQVILGLVDFDQNAQSAVCEARIHHQWYPDEVNYEQGFSPDTIALLKSWGQNMRRADSIGHCMLVRRLPNGDFEGGADPRRTGGMALGY